jgi:hypothetical protein
MAARRCNTPDRKWTAKLVVPALAVLASVGAHGFAASQGFSSSGLAAGSEVIASCGSGMKVAYTSAYSAAGSGYAVDGIELEHSCRLPEQELLPDVPRQQGHRRRFGRGRDADGGRHDSEHPVTPSSKTIDAGRVSGVR